MNSPAEFAERRRFRVSAGRIGLAWLTAVGVDLFFNAGVFATLFDQAREPSLLPDVVLARRIPVAYAALGVAVIALAWLLRLSAHRGAHAIGIGAGAGFVLGVAGVGALWTAIDMTGTFVLAEILVTVAEFGAAAAVLASPRKGWSLSIRVAIAFVVLAGLGQVVANLMSP